MQRPALLTGNLRRTLFVLAMPVLLEQFLSFCVGLYDTLLAGHLGNQQSEPATVAVGVGAYVGWLATMLFSLVAAGTTALVARARGAGDDNDANRILNRSFALALVAGLGFLVVIFPLAPYVARAVASDPEAVAIATRYLRLDAIGLALTSLSLVGSAALRGCGDMRTPMWILGAVSVLNVIASTILVHGWGPVPPLGVDGIVTGTIIARSTGGLAMAAVLARGKSGLQLQIGEMRVRGASARRILRIGGPSALDGSIMWSGHFVFLTIIGSFGETAMAAHIVGIRVEAITYLPAVAWAAAAATMIGQSLGAGDVHRARRAGHEAAIQCGLLGVGLTVLFFVGARLIYAAMHNSVDVVAVGAPPFRLAALFQIPLIMGIVYVGGLRGAGDTRTPMLITLFSTYGLRVPGAYVFGVLLEGGLYGAWIAMCIDMLARGVLAFLRFARGKWVDVRV